MYPGNYEGESYNEKTGSYTTDPNLGILVTVEETFDNDHRVVSQRGGPKGRVTFSAADSGLHRICFAPEHGSNSGWFSSGGAVKLTIDIATGESSKLESEDKTKMEDMAQRVASLNARLQDIRREQVFQRVSDSSCFLLKYKGLSSTKGISPAKVELLLIYLFLTGTRGSLP